MYVKLFYLFFIFKAPQSMKSILSASWCLTVALGNLLVVIVAESKFVDNQVYEYILFAGLLFVATIVFIIISWFYKYIEDTSEPSESLISSKHKKFKKNQKETVDFFPTKFSNGILNRSKLLLNFFFQKRIKIIIFKLKVSMLLLLMM
jgi:hypothetical protein